MYYVYILKDIKTGSLYKGLTRDLERRLFEHRNKESGFTARGNHDYRLAWFCAFQNLDVAVSFEKYLKTGSGIAFTRKRLI